MIFSDPFTKIMIEAAYHELGIAPISYATYDFNKILSSLSFEEARKMKRKFRKIWRKCAKNAKYSSQYRKQLGIGTQSPSKAQKMNRKREVVRHVIVDIVAPVVKKMTNQ